MGVRMKLPLLFMIALVIPFSFAALDTNLFAVFNYSIFNSTYEYNKWNGTSIVGAEILPDGKRGGAVNFSTANAIVKYETIALQWLLLTTDSFTISMWVNISDATNTHSYFLQLVDDGGFNDVVTMHYNKVNQNIYFKILDAAGGGSNCESPVILPAMFENEYMMVTLSFNNANNSFQGYLNGTKVCSGTQNTVFIAWERMIVGNHRAEGNAMSGGIDEILLYDRFLTHAEITELYNGGTGLFYPFSSPAPTGQLDLIFKNATSADKNLYDEGEDFNIFLNYTLSNGTVMGAGDCNLSIDQGIIETDGANPSFTLCAGCDFTTYWENFPGQTAGEHTTDQDYLHFKGCHEQLPQGSINATISCSNGVYSELINPASLSVCSAGSSLALIASNICVNQTAVNLSVSFLGINNRRKLITDFALDRAYNSLNLYNGSSVEFNSTLGLYDVPARDFEYYEHGSYEIKGNCSSRQGSYSADKSENVTIVNQPPAVSISGLLVGDYQHNFTGANDTVPYKIGSWRLLFSLVDDDLAAYVLNVTNSTGLIAEFNNLSELGQENISSDLFRDLDNPFNITLWANDTYGNESVTELGFIVVDAVDPTATGLDNALLLQNTTYNWNVNIYDESVFSFNITCNNTFNYSITGLNTNNYNFVNSSVIEYDTSCPYIYADGHTAEKLDYTKFLVYPINNGLMVVNDGHSVKLSSPDNFTFNYGLLSDRVEFEAKNKVKDRIFFYYEASEKSYNFKDQKYAAWIIDAKTNTWLDFNTDDKGAKIKVKLYNQTATTKTWQIEIETKEKDIKFKSIGALNIVTGTQFLNITAPAGPSTVTPLTTVSFDTVGEALLFWLLFVLWLAFIVMTFTLRGPNGHTIQIFNIAGLLFGLFAGINSIAVINPWFGFITIMLTVTIFLAKAFGDD